MSMGHRIYLTGRSVWVLVMTLVTLPIVIETDAVQTAARWEPAYWVPLLLALGGLALAGRDAYVAIASGPKRSEPTS